jgi:leucine dehydrogenase
LDQKPPVFGKIYMSAPWDQPDFDDHEGVHFFSDARTGLKAIVAIHSSFRGPAGGGTRYWDYASSADAVRDALRLSKGMSYKNAMAGLKMGGGKAVILADNARPKSPELLAAFARSIDSLAGRYVTAQDVGMSQDDLTTVGQTTPYVAGLIPEGGKAGGDPGPSTALGVYLGVKAVARQALGRDDLKGVRIAVQGLGSVGGGVARYLAAEGAQLILADVDVARATKLAQELDGTCVGPDQILSIEADILSPCALGAILNEKSIGQLKVKAIAGGANNQLARPEDAQRLFETGIIYAPDYVINAGGIINVALQYLDDASADDVKAKLEEIPLRLSEIWAASTAENLPPSLVADAMAQKLIGRA